MMNLFVMETTLYIIFFNFSLVLNKIIYSFLRSLSIFYMCVLIFVVCSHAFLTFLISESNLVRSRSSMIGYLLSWLSLIFLAKF